MPVCTATVEASPSTYRSGTPEAMANGKAGQREGGLLCAGQASGSEAVERHPLLGSSHDEVPVYLRRHPDQETTGEAPVRNGLWDGFPFRLQVGYHLFGQVLDSLERCPPVVGEP